jgi:NADH-quinone oxidoreductase subunit A
MNAYAGLLIYLAAILGFVALTLAMNRWLGPQPVPQGAKLEPFECGATAIEPVGDRALPVKYYGIAIVFILFDLETVFLYLWALGAQPVVTAGALFGLSVFVALLVLIMVYVWRSGLLEEITR